MSLDPSILTVHSPRSADEALAHKERQRKERSLARKEKRHGNPEAKQSRKASAKRAGKWTAERKEVDRLKNAANRSAKAEKKKRRCDEDATLVKQEVQDVPIIDANGADEPDQSSAEEPPRKKKSEKKSEAAKEVPEGDAQPANKPSKKKNRDKKSKPIEDGQVDEMNPEAAQVKKDKKNKSKKAEVVAEEPASETESVKKQSKKGKKSSKPNLESEDLARETETVEKSSEKDKKDKKRKREAQASEPTVAEEAKQADESTPSKKKAKKEKEDKKNKKEKKKKHEKHEKNPEKTALMPEEDKGPALTAEAEAASWNVGALDGGADRRAKFLRLLGGGKKTGAPAAVKSSGSSSRPHLDINKVTDELAHQFEAGRKMKFDMGGQRKGLGA